MAININIKTKKPLNWRIAFYFFAVCVGIALLCFFPKVWYIDIIVPVLLAWLFIRFFFAKLKIMSGDVVYLFGLPGSGKSCFLSKIGIDNKERTIVCNDEYSHYKLCNAVVSRDEFGAYRFPGESLILFDESSLDGFDNRDFKTNFDNDSLYYLKKIRQYDSAIVFANHGADELDKKIRDGLVNKFYFVENMGRYSRATLIEKEIFISAIDGEIKIGNCFPGFFERLFRPECVLYCWHAHYGKYYNTINVKRKPYTPKVANLDEH